MWIHEARAIAQSAIHEARDRDKEAMAFEVKGIVHYLEGECARIDQLAPKVGDDRDYRHWQEARATLARATADLQNDPLSGGYPILLIRYFGALETLGNPLKAQSGSAVGDFVRRPAEATPRSSTVQDPGEFTSTESVTDLGIVMPIMTPEESRRLLERYTSIITGMSRGQLGRASFGQIRERNRELPTPEVLRAIGGTYRGRIIIHQSTHNGEINTITSGRAPDLDRYFNVITNPPLDIDPELYARFGNYIDRLSREQNDETPK